MMIDEPFDFSRPWTLTPALSSIKKQAYNFHDLFKKFCQLNI